MSVSSKHVDEQLGGRIVRKVRLRLQMAPRRTATESEDQSINSEVPKSEKNETRQNSAMNPDLARNPPPAPLESRGKGNVFSADYALRR